MAGHSFEACVDIALLATTNTVYRSLHIVIDATPWNTAEHRRMIGSSAKRFRRTLMSPVIFRESFGRRMTNAAAKRIGNLSRPTAMRRMMDKKCELSTRIRALTAA